MSLPERVQERVGDDQVTAELPLGGEDRLVVTQSEILVYRAQGLLSDESVASHSHTVERVTVSDGRRNSKITLDYGIDGEESLKVPVDKTDQALEPIIAGVLSTANITEPDETTLQVFRFSDLLLVVTSDRIVEHIGAAVWDNDYEEFRYEDINTVEFEEGSVATSVVLKLDDRRERFKTPNEQVQSMRVALTEAVCEYHDVDSLEELCSLNESESDADQDSGDESSARTDFGVGPDPLSTSPAGVGTSTESVDSVDDETASDARVDPLDSESESQPLDQVSDAESGADSTPSPDSGDDRTDQSRDTEDELSTTEPDSGEDTGDELSTTGLEAETDQRSGDDPESDTSLTETQSTEEHEQTASTTSTADDSGRADQSSFEFSGPERADLAEEVATLRDTVQKQGKRIERQGDRIDSQSEYIKQLIEELRRGR